MRLRTAWHGRGQPRGASSTTCPHSQLGCRPTPGLAVVSPSLAVMCLQEVEEYVEGDEDEEEEEEEDEVSAVASQGDWNLSIYCMTPCLTPYWFVWRGMAATAWSRDWP